MSSPETTALEKKHSHTFLVPKKAQVVSIEPLTEMEKLMELSLLDQKPLHHSPGQFVEVSIPGVGEAPISICSSPSREASFQLCLRKAGSVTNALHQLQPGNPVYVRGPFGHGFPLDQFQKKDILLVAGGLGLAPMRSLIQHIFDERKDFGKVTLLYGCKRPEEILFLDELKNWRKEQDCEIFITVDRANYNWAGHVGVVTVLFNRIAIQPEKTVAVVVGPPVMFKFVLLELLARKISNHQIFVSLERKMKCGVGKCGHCQMGEFYVCKEGPVFRYSDLRHCDEAFGWKRK